MGEKEKKKRKRERNLVICRGQLFFSNCLVYEEPKEASLSLD
jgi:hypothetical protein